ncbi:MAG: MFS transporter [Dehalococcoidia bacterium]
MVTLTNLGRNAGQRFFPALGHRDFRSLWLAATASDSASWALITARAWLAKSLAEDHGNTWVGVTIFAAMIPYILVTPFAGLLADRMVRRNLLALVFALNLAQNAALTTLALADVIQMWHLVLLSFLSGSGRALQTPTSFSLVANLVPREDLINAYALNAATFHASRLVGPGLIAPLMAAIDLGWVFLICNIFFVVGIIQVLRIRTMSTGVVEPTRGVLYNLLAGLRYSYNHRVLLFIVVLIAFHCSLTMSFESLLPVLSEERFSSGGSGVAYLMTSVGAGALVVSVALAGIKGDQLRGRLLFMTGIASAIAPLALAAAPSLALGMLATATMGASQTAFMVITLAMMQSIVPDAIRGRISSIYILHAAGVMSFANLGNGSLADVFDPSWMLSIAGLAFLAVMIVSLAGPTFRRVYLAGVPPRVAEA